MHIATKDFFREIIFESKSLGFINNSLLFETTFESPVNEISRSHLKNEQLNI